MQLSEWDQINWTELNWTDNIVYEWVNDWLLMTLRVALRAAEQVA